jgi:predicted O-methyltransferase YrrM
MANFPEMHLILTYLKFLIKSTNQHGVHSPFVFSLVTKCFYDKKKHPAYEIIKEYRKKLLQNKKTINVTDFGAGSRVFSSNERKISAIAKNAGITSKRAQLLNRLVRYLNIEKILELGTSLGISTAAMAAGNKVQVTTIEGCSATAEIAREQFEEFGWDNIESKVGEFGTILNEGKYEVRSTRLEVKEENSKFQIPNSTSVDSQFATENRNQKTENEKPKTTNYQQQTTYNKPPQTFDLVFIDGNHQKEATLNYFEKLLSAVHNDSVMIFDDIHWSKEMEAAWEEIKLHSEVSVTIDTFYWGLVFFRREQAKEHFVIRV